MASRVAWAWVLSVGAVACGGNREPAHFAGSPAEPRATPAEISDVGYHPKGFDLIGNVSSRCGELRNAEPLAQEPLYEIACSEELLTAALRYKAAKVGGQVLVARRCTADASSGDGVVERECHAAVGRARDESTKPPADAVPPSPVPADDEPWLAAPADAWRVVVMFSPAGLSRRPVARDIDEVRESPYLPASDVPLGDVVAVCNGRCNRSVLREAVRATAARVGADSVSEVKCVEGSGGRACTGRAGIYEVDPRTVAKAR